MQRCTGSYIKPGFFKNNWYTLIYIFVHQNYHYFKVLFGELHTTEHWVSKHISDHSGFHYRQFLLTSLQKQSSDLKEQFSVCYKNLILKELTMITDLIRSFEAHEALWYHRFVSLPWRQILLEVLRHMRLCGIIGLYHYHVDRSY